MKHKPTSKSEPVNIVVSQTLKENADKQAFEKLLRRLVKAARRYTGHEGATVISDASRRYHLVYRFTSHAKLNQWLSSSEREQLREQIKQYVEEDELKPQKHTGMEAWFKAYQGPHLTSPPRWKTFLATLVAAYPVVVLFQWQLVPRIEGWPLLIRAAAFPIVLLSTMTYVVMPVVTRLLESWLYQDAD